MAQYDIDLRNYWRIIRKRRSIVLFTTGLLALFSFVFAKFNEPVPIYTATAAVRFERSRTVAVLLPLALHRRRRTLEDLRPPGGATRTLHFLNPLAASAVE